MKQNTNFRASVVSSVAFRGEREVVEVKVVGVSVACGVQFKVEWYLQHSNKADTVGYCDIKELLFSNPKLMPLL